MQTAIYLAITLFLVAMSARARRAAAPGERRLAWLWFAAAGLTLAAAIVRVVRD